MTDLDLARLVSASYGMQPTIQALDIRLVITGPVVAIPGTRETVLADWIRDLSCMPHTSRTHPRLGECHDGCLTGAEAVLEPVLERVSGPYILAAHSLGGGVGVLLAALMTLYGKPPSRLVTFGAMRSSIGATVPGILADVPGVHYRHASDPVPDLPPLYSEWRQRTQLGLAGVWPSVGDHLMGAYVGALVPN